MPNETRVNLHHLLEDIRDSYHFPIEEVIVTELIANALDSRASQICFYTDPTGQTMTCVDNGCGMRRPSLRDYHNIAATTKERGQGIGFAGLGAKLSLLIADEVVTETRAGYGSRAATTWRFSSQTRAPWKFIPAPGLVPTSRGTAVRIVVRQPSSPLSEPAWLTATVRKHFYPLLSEEVHRGLLKFVYKNGVSFFVNDQALQHEEETGEAKRSFFVYLGKRSRRPVGYGYLLKATDAVPIEKSGIGVSTYGKVIKRGWEWLGLMPRSQATIHGLVEIPGLAEVLTTNKTDFLSDQASLKKYYRYRKAAQNAIQSILREWGEEGGTAGPVEKELKPLQQEISSVLRKLVGDFPELEPLVGSVKRESAAGAGAEAKAAPEEYLRGEGRAAPAEGGEIEQESVTVKPRTPARTTGSAGNDQPGGRQRKEPGLKIAFEELMDSPALGRVAGETVFVNTAHPAWNKAKSEGLEVYHVLATVAWTLSVFLEPDRPPHDFVSKFFATWGSGGPYALRLFRPGPPGGWG